ncbi:hypothetical protein TrRE_jg5398 [Triparma retinervis]|uniref:Uncharacterized protein n=1 Tax=Triparma retinervis TaxID=2557542 RepID=A0A9W7A1K4_9STRA|nr:hypothetical protein TrRE_jg5398 [Triparma retinervis]
MRESPEKDVEESQREARRCKEEKMEIERVSKKLSREVEGERREIEREEGDGYCVEGGGNGGKGGEGDEGGEKTEARECYERFARFCKDNGEWRKSLSGAYHDVGACLVKGGDVRGGLKWMRDSVVEDPTNPHPWNGAGVALAGMGREGECRTCFEKGMTRSKEEEGGEGGNWVGGGRGILYRDGEGKEKGGVEVERLGQGKVQAGECMGGECGGGGEGGGRSEKGVKGSGTEG